MEGPAPVSQEAQTTTALAAADRRLPDMTYSEQESELRSALRSVLDDRASFNAVLARIETPDTYDTALWRTLAAEIGCAGLLVPESLGGAGASFREVAVLAEEVGRAVAPVPYLGSAVLATVALLSVAGSDASSDLASELLTELAAGSATATLAVPFTSMPGSRPEPTVRIGPAAAGDEGGIYRLSGSVAGVADGLPADVLLVPADGVPYGLYVVRAAEAGVTRTPVVSLDMTRQLCDLTLEDVPARQVAAGSAAELAVRAALQAGAAMLAAEQSGLAERALDVTLGYVKQRYQFARPVGSFQAVKHRLADWWVAMTQARAASRYAAACLADGDPDTPVAVALAKAVCSDTAVLAGQEMIQLHGGIGFTWEHPAHLYLKRAKSSSLALGTADRHRGALASLVNLPGVTA
ncbi:MAG TPA: acyl-CoA dehydrogenase family protein [Streptosporangiaceae bacterium]|nr:acyl-CoA dehydrogenase family protein [Streptosporangiaceae bacterium]